VKTHCACPTASRTSSRKRAAVAAPRFAPHDGHSPRPLHENATRTSRRQPPQWSRANPFSKIPQSRYRATAPSTIPRQKL
jgi:hypothetical protein